VELALSDAHRAKLASTWHAGERAMQQRAGVDDSLAGLDVRIFRNHLSDVQQAFYARLSYAVIGSVDKAGDVWATMIEGRPGFLSAHGAFALDVAAERNRDDPADEGLEEGDAIGMLGIDLSMRRRLRLNGHVERTSQERFRLAVEQSFGNCPKYIQAREASFPSAATDRQATFAEELHALDEPARALIASSDTFFVASYVDREAGERQVDASHRGGLPGFMRVEANGVLSVPEFPGNTFYNTLGNFVLNPRAGLCCADFRTGDVLQMTGDVRLGPHGEGFFLEAEQFWQFLPRRIVRRRNALRQRWSLFDDGWSPDSLDMGTWEAT
jgi:predicted pyridoxine 5'-phosphate oxidase superfamily flavin-nucleotide-binding protein